MLLARHDAGSVTTYLTLPRWLDTKVELPKGDHFCSLVSSYQLRFWWQVLGTIRIQRKRLTRKAYVYLPVNMKQNHLWMVNGFKRDDSCKQCKASHSRDLKILYSLWKDFIKMSSSNSSNSHRMLKTNMQPS